MKNKNARSCQQIQDLTIYCTDYTQYTGQVLVELGCWITGFTTALVRADFTLNFQ